MKKLDVLFGNEEDFSAMLGIKLEGVKELRRAAGGEL